MKARHGVLLALALLGIGARAETAVWMLPAIAPAVMPDGPFAGQGALEIGLRALGDALPQFDWRYEFATPLRELREIERRDGLCSLGFAKLPEREKVMLFNNRPMVTPGFGVILREDRAGEFRRFQDLTGAVDLDLLGEARDLSGGYVAGRPHFGTVKDFIDAKRGRLIADSDTGRLFRQLKAGHLDYLFGLRDEVAYFAASLGEDAKFVSMPVIGADRFGKAYIACSAGPIGRRAMEAIDAYLADDAHWAAFMEPWRRWLSPEDYAAAVRSPLIR